MDTTSGAFVRRLDGSDDRVGSSSGRPGLREVWTRPLPHQRGVPLTRFLCRTMTTVGRRQIRSIRGLEHIAPANDPFVLAANHSQRLEAVLLPTTLIYHRDGKLIHFLADWPTLLVPLAGLLLRRSGAIIVSRKNAKLRPLNRLKPLFRQPGSAFGRALETLESGASVGVFPESTMNRHPRRLLRGQTGAVHLALRSGAAVVPVGIRFPGQDPERPIRDRAAMEIEIGPPIPPPSNHDDQPRAIPAFHARIMGELARLSGKAWDPTNPKRSIPCL